MLWGLLAAGLCVERASASLVGIARVCGSDARRRECVISAISEMYSQQRRKKKADSRWFKSEGNEQDKGESDMYAGNAFHASRQQSPPHHNYVGWGTEHTLDCGCCLGVLVDSVTSFVAVLGSLSCGVLRAGHQFFLGRR